MLARSRSSRWLRRAVALALAGALAACAGQPNEPDVVTVGVGSTTEQRLLAALTVVALEEAGLNTEIAPDLGGMVGVRREALRDAIDVYWDYTASAWAQGLHQQNPPADPQESFERVQEADRDRNDLVWLEPSEANATLALFVDPEALDEQQSPTMDWLAGELSGQQRTLCVDPAFRDRRGGLRDLAEVYPMDLNRVRVREASEKEAIAGVAAGRCLAGLATATSGGAYAEGLVRVRDNLSVLPAFVVAPVAREAALAHTPRIADALKPVTELLDTSTLARLNAAAQQAETASERQDLARRELAGHLEGLGDG